jgi:DNA invertase Pin-like site-specific DNA recombinase
LRLDRLECSLRHLLDTVTALQARWIRFQALTVQIDTAPR